MEECELCGRPMDVAYVVMVEDVELRVCAKDAKGKKVLRTSEDERARTKHKTTMPKKEEEQTLVENFGKVIQKARERMQLPIKVLAEMINEKETLLSRVEKEETLPSVTLTKKLEKALGIKLVEGEPEAKERVSFENRSDKATLGDFLGKEN
jgi:putative transcription factor